MRIVQEEKSREEILKALHEPGNLWGTMVKKVVFVGGLRNSYSSSEYVLARSAEGFEQKLGETKSVLPRGCRKRNSKGRELPKDRVQHKSVTRSR